MKTLFFECTSGISGDMTVASLIDLGVPKELVLEQLNNLALDGYKINICPVKKCGISALSFQVLLAEQPDSSHRHIGFSEIKELLGNSSLNVNIKSIAIDIFTRIANAEGKIHGIPRGEVKFHEIGAVDSIVDIVSAAVCIDYLAPDRVVFSKIHEGCGFVNCAHGILPVPAPATAELLKNACAQLVFTQTEGEMVTPTGAGIAASIGNEFGLVCPSGRISAIGCGAGNKEFSHPNILRTFLIETDVKRLNDTVCVFEATIDDMTGESLGYAMNKLFSAGCLDVYYTPVQMKKCRPAVLLTALCPPELETQVLEAIFKHTTTIGVRKHNSEREIMRREMINVKTLSGIFPVKKCSWNQITKYHPEFDNICELADAQNIPVSDVLCEINRELTSAK